MHQSRNRMFLLEIYSTKDQYYIIMSGGTSGTNKRSPAIHILCIFLGRTGYSRPPIIVYQDNLSTIKLIENGRSTSELTRHIEIGYFWVKDLVDRGLISIMYCPTDMMIADFFTKPLQGSLFEKMKGKIMGTYPYTAHADINKT